MRQVRLIAGFLGRFVLVYGLLIAPWPGFNAAYGRFFRAMNQRVFAHEAGRRLVEFDAVPAELKHVLDTRIMLGNRDQAGSDGNIPVRYLELDSRGVGWVPTALLLALILATPVPWRWRGQALFWGLLAVHGFIVFSVAVYLWNNSPALDLLRLSPFWKQITEGLEETLVTQMGASFVVPAFIWIFATLRKSDLVA